MPLGQQLGTILKKAQVISKRILKFGVRCIEWTLTSIIAVVMGIVVTVVGAGKALYQARSKIIGTLLLVGVTTLLLLWANRLVDFKDSTDSVHSWLMLDYRWVITAGVVSEYGRL